MSSNESTLSFSVTAVNVMVYRTHTLDMVQECLYSAFLLHDAAGVVNVPLPVFLLPS